METMIFRRLRFPTVFFEIVRLHPVPVQDEMEEYTQGQENPAGFMDFLKGLVTYYTPQQCGTDLTQQEEGDDWVYKLQNSAFFHVMPPEW